MQKRKRGRPAPEYGPIFCPGCHRPPRYRDGVLVACICGAAPNPHAPRVIRGV